MSRSIEIVEVGPRDGLQNEKAVLSVQDRLEMIARLEAAGARRIEAVSFVNERRVPQMAGAEDIMTALPRHAGRRRIGLVLNQRGWDRAIASGCDEANVVITATDGFGLANQGATTADQLRGLAGMTGGPPITVTIAVTFGCPFDGEVREETVRDIAADLAGGKTLGGYGAVVMAHSLIEGAAQLAIGDGAIVGTVVVGIKVRLALIIGPAFAHIAHGHAALADKEPFAGSGQGVETLAVSQRTQHG